MPVGILNGTSVVECATFVTGPYAAALLGELGARIIKIEAVPDGDPYRYFAPDPCFSFNFAHLNRNKESLALDLKAPQGKKIACELIERSDVFIENFRPGTAERLGLGYEALRAVNPRLVYCSISAFGASGPYVDKPGFDTLGQAMSGLLSLLTDREEPKVMGMALSDYVTGLSAAYGILGGLLARQQSSAGCRVETSLLQATFSFIGETAAGAMRTGNIPSRMARVKNAHAFAFLCKDGLPLAIHCSVPEKFWVALLNALDKSDLSKDERFATRDARRENYEALERQLAPVFATRARAEWLARLEGFDVPVAPIYNMGEVLSDPQVRHLGLVEELDDRGAGKMGFAGPPVTYAGLSSSPSLPPPMLGAQTRTILSELGYSDAAVEELVRLLVARSPKSDRHLRGRQL